MYGNTLDCYLKPIAGMVHCWNGLVNLSKSFKYHYINKISTLSPMVLFRAARRLCCLRVRPYLYQL